MKKEIKFKGRVQVGSKIIVISKLSDTKKDLIKKVKELGLTVLDIISIEEVIVDTSKQRGRPATYSFKGIV